VFHISIWGAWSFVLGGLSPPKPSPWRRDWVWGCRNDAQ